MLKMDPGQIKPDFFSFEPGHARIQKALSESFVSGGSNFKRRFAGVPIMARH